MNTPRVFPFLTSAVLLWSNPVKSQAPFPPANIDEWTGWGGNIYNNRWNSINKQINSSSISSLVQNCVVDYSVGIVVDPVIVDQVAYYPAGDGFFYALNYISCAHVWTLNVTDIIIGFAPPSPYAGTQLVSRTAPQIDLEHGVLYFGTQTNALLVTVDMFTGEVLAVTQVHPHPVAVITAAPTFYNGLIIVGVSSLEEYATLQLEYECCSFIGRLSAYYFDKCSKTFTEAWTFDTLPDGWAGASIWGSQPSIDPSRNQVFIGVGNAYSTPTAYEHCVNETTNCLPDDIYMDCVVAIDLATGVANWKFSVTPLDAWVFSCDSPPYTNCPYPPGGPDADFGMAPAFVPASLGAGTTGVDSVVIGQKSGNIFNLNAATGEPQWTRFVGNGTTAEFLLWGIAADDSQVYFTLYNRFGVPLTLPSGQQITNSAWGALSLQTGEVVWETQSPDSQLADAPLGVVGDVVIGSVPAGGGAAFGSIVALSKRTGEILSTIPLLGAPQHGGVSTKGGFLLFGTGDGRNASAREQLLVYGLPDAISLAKGAVGMVTSPVDACTRGLMSTTTTTTTTTEIITVYPSVTATAPPSNTVNSGEVEKYYNHYDKHK
jgi:polyvinyl alcohol dehydrogenase (cytochrome)